MLIKISCIIPNGDLSKHLSSLIGKIGSTNALPYQIRHVIRNLAKPHSKRYFDQIRFINTIDILNDMILGESISPFYYFDRLDNSFIKLKPLVHFANGYLAVGYLQIERNEEKELQGIFSLCRGKSGKEYKSYELLIQGDNTLIYRTYDGDKEECKLFEKLEIKENAWHLIIISHIGKEVMISVDGVGIYDRVRQMNSIELAVMGCVIDQGTMRPVNNFTGELSKWNFYSCESQNMKDFILKQIIIEGSVGNVVSVITGKINLLNPENNLPKYKEILENALSMTIDPTFSIFSNRKCEGVPEVLQQLDVKYNCIDTFKGTQLFFNRPAKDIFVAFGGFKSIMLVLTNLLQNMQTNEDKYFFPGILKKRIIILLGIMRILHACCLNNDKNTVSYCIENGGIDALKCIMQIVGENGRFPHEFAEVLINILELPIISESNELNLLAPHILCKCIFNPLIWDYSDQSVQVFFYNVLNH